MYSEMRLPRLSATLWRSVPDAQTSSSLIVPDGCMDLIILDAEVVVAGADTTARIFTGESRPTVGLRFDSGVLPQLLRTSAAELADAVTPLDAVITGATGVRRVIGPDGIGDSAVPAALRAEHSEIYRSASALVRIAALLRDSVSLDSRPLLLADSLNPPLTNSTSTNSPTSIAEVAADFAYSPRQLRRLSAEWFGYGPKHLAKILRWKSARALIGAGHTRTFAAASAGYADAAHLWRDEQSLIGTRNQTTRRS